MTAGGARADQAYDPYGFDQSFRDRGLNWVVGIDEAGRGPMAGPVVAAAVVLPAGVRIPGLRDSKKVPEHERKTLCFEIVCCALDIGIGVSDAGLIDSINILQATRAAMTAAIADLSQPAHMLLIDAVKLSSLSIPQVSPFKGESVSASIAAASIVAKVTRDNLMCRYHEEYPEYGFDRHKGYGTKDHMDAIQRFGACPIHRKSFRGVISTGLPF